MPVGSFFIDAGVFDRRFLAGGDIVDCVLALIAAEKAGIPLSYDRACAIDLAVKGTSKTVLEAVMSEAKGKNLYYYAVGNELNLDKFNMFVDFMYSQEGIDRNGTITGIVGNAGGHNAFNAGYLSVVTKLNYRFLPKWNAFVKGMYETASVTKAADGIEKGNYRTSWGYLAGVEFYPMKTNLHFFLTYVGRSYDFTHRAKVLGQENYSTNRLSLGFIYQLPMF